MQILDAIVAWLAEHGLNIVAALTIFIVGRIVARRVTNFLGNVLARNNVDGTLTSFFKNFTFLALMAAVVVASLNMLGFETTSIVAILGAATLAIGFALQDFLSNFAAGVMIILMKPYAVGDLVEINEARGFVDEVQVFNTILKTFENERIIVANNAALGANITNYSANGCMRLDMVFGVSYQDDLLKVKAILKEILSDQPEVLTDPAPIVAVLELGDSSINFAVQPFIKAEDYWTVHFNTHEQVKLRFDAAGISIPYPTRDINLVQPIKSLKS